MGVDVEGLPHLLVEDVFLEKVLLDELRELLGVYEVGDYTVQMGVEVLLDYAGFGLVPEAERCGGLGLLFDLGQG